MTLIGCVIDGDTSGVIFTDVKEENLELLPTSIELYQNYPNPFNPSTTIRYDIKEKGYVTLIIYDLLGRELATLVNGNKEEGRYTANFNASSLPSGVYIYTLRVNDFTSSKKMTILK